MKSVEAFEKTYKKQPQYTAFTPYRICPIGATATISWVKLRVSPLTRVFILHTDPRKTVLLKFSLCSLIKERSGTLRLRPNRCRMTGRTISEVLQLRSTDVIRFAEDFALLLTVSFQSEDFLRPQL